MSHRVEKFSSTLKQALGEILLLEMENPLFKSISISHVVVSSDLKNARIFVSSFSPDVPDITKELTRALGSIKQHLRKKMSFKFMPNIQFFPDSGFQMDQQLTHLFSNQNHEKQ